MTEPCDLALQHEDLVTERKDLSVSGITGRKYPADSCENEACKRGNQIRKTSTLFRSRRTPKILRTTVRMTPRRLKGRWGP